MAVSDLTTVDYAEVELRLLALLPGSPEAKRKNCTCPIEPNIHGKGFRPVSSVHTYYFVERACPIHGFMVNKSCFD